MKNIFLIIALIATTIIAYLADPISAGVVFAFTQGMYTTDMQWYRRLLLEKAHRVAWNVPLWSSFYGYPNGKKDYFEPVSKFGSPITMAKPTGAPFEIYEDFGPRKGIHMDVPIYYPLKGRPTYGGATLKGKGERPTLANIQVAVNEVRKAYLAQDTKMSKQVIQSPAMIQQLLRSANDYLADYFLRWNSYQPYLAFLEGASENLTDPNHGLGVQKTSHMNIYVTGDATPRVAFSTTHATYEAAVATKLAGLSDTSSDHMSTDVIEEMVYNASHNHRIQPVLVGGKKVYPIVISDAAGRQLQQDEKWINRGYYAYERGFEKNPLLQGKVAGYYSGALIFTDECIPSAYINGDGEYSTTRSTTGDTAGVCYGSEDSAGEADYMAIPVDSGSRKANILFGKSAIAVGKAQEIDFEDEFDDFKHKHEVGADMICGMRVADIIDTEGYFGTAGNKRYENVSSLVQFTFSD